MKSLYAHLAADNIRKNRRLYIPYLLSGSAMTAILFILSHLSRDPAVLAVKGGDALASLLRFGVFIMMFFSAIFLFYTCSFLMKQRNRELGLYSVLGMSKLHVVRIILCETLFCALLSVGSGLALGLLLAKLFQLALLAMTGAPADTSFALSLRHVPEVCLTFGIIYAALALVSAFHVLRSRPLELMNSSRAGERAPRANAPFAMLGVAALAGGYYLSLSAHTAIEAFSLFFPAVMLVILGTETCFRSGSVFLLRLMRGNKSYYYRPNHFISVSGMSYRMKRNGSSLSVICILSTMVLVTLSCVTCLYVGTADITRQLYPRQMEFTLRTHGFPDRDALRAPLSAVLDENGVTAENVIDSQYGYMTGYLEDGRFIPSQGGSTAFLSALTVMPLDEYRAACGTDAALAPGQALVGGSLAAQLQGRVEVEGLGGYDVVQSGIPYPESEEGEDDMLDGLLLVVPSAEELERCDTLMIITSYDFDLGHCPMDVYDLIARLKERLNGNGLDYTFRNGITGSDGLIGEYAGLFFLGIMLSLAFTCAAVLTMYYKQITEGYEDQANFAIMRKVGLSRRMIRQSVNSQILTVFFLPLVVSGIHIAFAFPMLTKLLVLLGLTNTRLLALVTLGSFALFALFYVAVYLVTSRIYYKIVSSEG